VKAAGAGDVKAATAVAIFLTCGCLVSGQADRGAVNDRPNPYRAVENGLKLPAGRTWGSTGAVDVDRDGQSLWVVERCGGAGCLDSNLAPILEFDAGGNLIRSFGAGLFAVPHGLFVDRDGNVWVTDASDGTDVAHSRGHQVFKFSPDGKLLLTLGRAGVPGNGPDTFNRPSDVIVAANGDIFVADGHGGDSNARIVKFSRNGRFIKAWGKKGSAPGEFDVPHSLALDSQGRLFVADLMNDRIQIFDQDGRYLDEWKQFGMPGGLFIDRNDVLYVADSLSNRDRHPGWVRGIRIGSARDGAVTAFIPDSTPDADPISAAEGVAADAAGHVFGAVVPAARVLKFVRK
jgi:sugar lactone lactonase YvrE